jgi:hypothetical protein
MVYYISYISPIVVAGIAGFTLTSIAFNKIRISLQEAINQNTVLVNLSSESIPIQLLNQKQIFLQRKLTILEMLVAFFYCSSEILLIYPFIGSLLFDSNMIQMQNDSVIIGLIIIAFIAIICALITSVLVYGYAIYFNFKTSLPLPYYNNFEEIKEARNQINQ